jgi:hypothetical protein
VFLRRRLKKRHVFGAFYLYDIFGAFVEGEEAHIICTRDDQCNDMGLIINNQPF